MLLNIALGRLGNNNSGGGAVFLSKEEEDERKWYKRLIGRRDKADRLQTSARPAEASMPPLFTPTPHCEQTARPLINR